MCGCVFGLSFLCYGLPSLALFTSLVWCSCNDKGVVLVQSSARKFCGAQWGHIVSGLISFLVPPASGFVRSLVVAFCCCLFVVLLCQFHESHDWSLNI